MIYVNESHGLYNYLVAEESFLASWTIYISMPPFPTLFGMYINELEI